MYQRILLYVDDRPESQVATVQALRMAQLCDARLFAVWVLPAPAVRDTSLTGAPPVRPRRRLRRRSSDPSSEPEELAWSRLYEIEDDAFEANVKTSLLLETGNRDEVLLALVGSYQLQALIIGARSLPEWESLIERCPVPVTIVR